MNWAVTYYRWWDIGGFARVWCIVADREEANRVAETLRLQGLVNVRVDATSYPLEAPTAELATPCLPPSLNEAPPAA
jgi:hypothetical protein